MYDLVEYFGNQEAAELLPSVPMTTGSPFSVRVLQSIKVTDIRAGDLLEFNGEFQVTVEHKFSVMAMSKVVLATSRWISAGPEICEANGQNIDRDTHHHWARTRTGMLKVTKDYSEAYVNLAIYVASTRAVRGNVVVVNKGYGRCTVKQYRPRIEKY